MAYQGTSIRTIPMPGATCRDLAVDGETLWVTSQGDARIYQIDIHTGNVIRFFSSPGSFPGGIDIIHEHDLGDWDIGPAEEAGGGWLLHTDWSTNTFYLLTQNGNVIKSFSMSGMVNIGIGLAHVGGTKMVVVGGATEPNEVALIDFKDQALIHKNSRQVRRGGYFDGRLFYAGSVAQNNFKSFRLIPSIDNITVIPNPMVNAPAALTGDGRTLYALDLNLSLIHQIA